MATNKKPRKKYRPRRLLLSGYGDRAVEFAAKAASNEPLGAADGALYRQTQSRGGGAYRFLFLMRGALPLRRIAGRAEENTD